MSKNTKNNYGKGYSDGRRDSRRIPTANEIINKAVVPGTLPSEKGKHYKSGYNQGKKDGRR